MDPELDCQDKTRGQALFPDHRAESGSRVNGQRPSGPPHSALPDNGFCLLPAIFSLFPVVWKLENSPLTTSVPVENVFLLQYNVPVAYLTALVTRMLRRSEEHTSELQSLMRISYAVFCLKKKNKQITKLIS